ncbi:recombinase family protein [Pedobacter aquatilis]|uniref:recombinase family protein n=1 Tax=Pedobacter aquatilis TaxID=351343 RepID=UPI0025B5C3D9|nr:recombinase family protein [Pedobacter aquatilis]MDN3587880.1 recombinase family protein [Pedobacter aquatilis]
MPTYCKQNIQIKKVIFEDHSAKTFIRPEWTKLVLELKKSKGKSSLVLFTKWDRFSRNAPDAYQMIALLKSFGVEPQAIEQPLDMSVPENKMMLAIYLTAPEIENDRRGLNTFYGIRRARKEGRWTNTAPVGYKNLCTPEGRKYIGFDDKQAKIMRWVFNELSLGTYSSQQIFNRASEMGLSCKKNRFLIAIRSKVYIGKVPVRAFKDEEEQWVKGQHKPLISEELFNEVQTILDGRKRIAKTTIYAHERMPLRGFLNCSRCDRIATSSASKGRKGYYYYYHCSSACGWRIKAEDADNVLLEIIKEHVLRPVSSEHFKIAIKDWHSNFGKDEKEQKMACIHAISDLNNRITQARELLLAGDIDASDYSTIKSEAENKIMSLETRLAIVSSDLISAQELDGLLNQVIEKITQLLALYCNSDSYVKRKIIGSMFRKKFTFEELKHRTVLRSIPYQMSYLINSKIAHKKQRASDRITCLPTQAPSAGLEPATL